MHMHHAYGYPVQQQADAQPNDATGADKLTEATEATENAEQDVTTPKVRLRLSSAQAVHSHTTQLDIHEEHEKPLTEQQIDSGTRKHEFFLGISSGAKNTRHALYV